MLCRVLVFLLCAAPIRHAEDGADETTRLDPRWTCCLPAGIEWCAATGGGADSRLLVCDKQARLHLLDLEAGAELFAEPVDVQPGTRFAGRSADVAYCFGRSEVVALRVGPGGDGLTVQPGVLWRAAAAPAAETPGDPEFLTRLVAAGATPAGVLVVRSDGRIAELNRDDGAVRWRQRLPPISACALHVRGATAALLWQRGGQCIVAFVKLQGGAPAVRRTALERSRPIWSGLADEGLVALWPDSFALVPPDGEPTFHDLPGGAEARAVALHAPAAQSPGDGAPGGRQPAARLLVRTADALLACDVTTGARRSWALCGDELEQAQDRQAARPADWARRLLGIAGDLLFVPGARGVGVRDVRTGDTLCSLRLDRPIDAAGHAGFAYALCAPTAVAAGGEYPRTLVLGRQRMGGVPGSVDSVPAGAGRFELGQVEPVREVYWLGGTLVIVEERRLRAYTLP